MSNVMLKTYICEEKLARETGLRKTLLQVLNDPKTKIFLKNVDSA